MIIDKIWNSAMVARLDISYSDYTQTVRTGGKAVFMDGCVEPLNVLEAADLLWNMAEKIPAHPGFFFVDIAQSITATGFRDLVARDEISDAFSRTPVIAWLLLGESCTPVTPFGVVENAAVLTPGGYVFKMSTGGRYADVKQWLLAVADELEARERALAKAAD